MNWDTLAQQAVSGVMTGSIYGVLALSLVMIFQSTQMFNFGQGEMATFCTYIGWALLIHVPYGAGFVLAILIAFAIGAALERGLVRMVEGKPPMNAVIIGLGLFLAFNSMSGGIWGSTPKRFPQPFAGKPIDLLDLGILVSKHNLYLFIIALLMTAAVYLLFQHTKLGLAMRVTAANREAAELMGIPTGLMMMLGWGLASALGAAAGMLVAPIVVLSPGMMFTPLLFGFAAAVLGGLDSPPGAILGGLIVGVTQNLVGVYLDDWVSFFHLPFDIRESNQYRDIVAMALILGVLTIRPRGIFGRAAAQRV